MRLVATDMHATFTARAPFKMPYHTGGLFHGLFGRALRKVGCPASTRCLGHCARGARGKASEADCDWQRLFSPPPPERAPHRLLVSMKEPPGPVVLWVPPPGEMREVSAGRSVSFGVRLFGDPCARDSALLEKALAAVAELPIGPEAACMELRAITRYSARNLGAEVGRSAGAERTACVRFETPLRVKRAGSVAEKVDFATLFSQVWRRLTVLGALYGEYGEGDDEVFRGLFELARGVRTVDKRLTMLRWEHLSVESGVRKPMCGLLGHVAFEGESLGMLLPVLRAGEAVHAGGATSFGLGRMRVDVP